MEYKLGALKPRPQVDTRTIRLKAILKPELLPPLPESYDVDTALGMPIPDAWDGNNNYANCVIAARAKHTRRFEAFEQGAPPLITEQEIIEEYKKETGGGPGWENAGLYVFDSLKKWRKDGWVVGGKTYKIYAFARVDWKDHVEAKYAIYLFHGIPVTIALPNSARNQKVWDVTTGPDAEWGSWGLHEVYMPQWLPPNHIGPVGLTWNRRQQMTWAWWDKYVCEAYAVIDDKDKWLPNSPVDKQKLIQLLVEVTNAPGAPTVTSVTPAEGKQGETVKNITIIGSGVSVDVDVLFGEGIDVIGVHAISYNELKIDEVVVTYDAEPGLRPVALDNGFGYGFKLNAFNVLKGDNPPPIPPEPVPPTPTPSPCKAGKAVASIMNVACMQGLRNRKGRFMYMDPK